MASQPDRDQPTGICDAVEELLRAGPGDILVFCSGEREIREADEALAARSLDGVDVLQLYARLSAAEQHRVFAPHDRRRVVLATNVAETSLTVPGVRFVVDAGTARISRFSRRTKVQRLPIEPISQASANQRAGRCGRVAPGICIRLFGEEDFEARPEFTQPEIMRTNLASVILTMATLRLGDVTDFPFVDPPPSRSITDGITLLEELGALDPEAAGGPRWVTPVGRKLARLPVDPRFGRMVLAAAELGCAREVMVLAAAMSLQDPRERPAEHQQAAAEQHARFADPSSDFLSLLNLWEYLREQQQTDSGNQFRRRCKREFLNHRRVREWQDINRQLRQMAGAVGIRPNRTAADADRIHQAVLAGLLSHIGLHEGTRRDYRGARNSRFVLARDSSLAKRPPRWVMAAELVETNQVWARLAAGIRPEWAEAAGGHLVKYSYGDPRWEPEQAQAMVDERVTLYGLPIVPARAVPYARVDPGDARAMFLQHGLAEGEWLDEGSAHHTFAAHNQELLEQIEAAEARMRRGLLTEHDPLLAFYDVRVGDDVTSGPRFNRWWKTARRADPELLHAELADLVEPERLDDGAADHPESWVLDGMELRVSYRHDPAVDDDGVTVHVPVRRLNRLRQAPFDWQVPGVREPLVVAWIRSLPKPMRQAVSPVGACAVEFLDRHGPDDGPLLPLLAAHLTSRGGGPVRESDFEPDRVPDHLRVTFAAEDGEGRVVGRSKSVVALKSHLREEMSEAAGEGARHLERSGCRSWEFGTIPRILDGPDAARGYPALVDEGESVGLRVFPTRIEQLRSMSAGTRRLVQLAVAPPARGFRAAFGDGLSLTEMPHDGLGALFQDSWDCVVGRLIADHGGLAWDEDDFTGLVDAVRREMPGMLELTAGELDRIFVGCGRLRRRLDEPAGPALARTEADVRAQLERLVYPGLRHRHGYRAPVRSAALPGRDGHATGSGPGRRRSGSAAPRPGGGARGGVPGARRLP